MARRVQRQRPSKSTRLPRLRELRVVFLATRDWYHPATTGGDNTLWENARYLASVGHDVTFVSSSFPGSAHKETRDGIEVIRLGGIYSLWFRTFLCYMSNYRSRCDVVVTEGFGGSRIPRLAPLYVKEPIITAWHQVHRELFRAQYPKLLVGPLSLLERGTAWVHRNTRVQAYSQEGKEAFPSIGFKAENVFVVPVSIRDEWLSESNGHPTDKPTILWIGKLRRYKCPDHAVLAMADVVRKIPSARLIIAARRDDVAYERQLQKLVKDLHLEGNVEFQFNVTEVDASSARSKRDVFRSSRVLVLPSSVEGFGIVVLEANACGVPVIASSGVPESAVRNGDNGLRYEFGQIEALSQRIIEVLTNDELYARLSANSLAFAKQFGWRRVGAQYAGIVRDALADKNRP